LRQQQPFGVHAGPEIRIVDQAGIAKLNLEESLAPAWSKPTFEVK
jgi:protein TorT